MSAPVGSDALDVADALSVAVATRNIEAVADISSGSHRLAQL